MPGSRPIKPVGRLWFLAYEFFAAAFWVVLYYLGRRFTDGTSQLLINLGFLLPGLLSARAIEGRLKDAGLPGWYFWPYTILLFLLCFIPELFKAINVPQALVLYSVLQVPTVFLRSKRAPLPVSDANLILNSQDTSEETGAN